MKSNCKTAQRRLFHFSSPLISNSSRLTPSLLLITCLLLLQTGCGTPATQSFEFSGPTMGSSYSVQIAFAPAGLAEEQIGKEITTILDDINLKMSTYLVNSELSIINAAVTNDWIAVSPELYTVLSAAERISRETDGAFDITVGPLVNLWGFGPGKQDQQQIPDPDEIIAARQHTGYRLIELKASPPSMRKHDPQLYLDLSGIVPGYAADRIAARLDSMHIENYLVDISGEIRARGKSSHHSVWRVGIEKPLDDRRNVQQIVILENTGMTTAGDYRNFFVHAGKRYSHTIDPASGWPVSHNLASVTVLDDSAMIADAMDTALMVMGPERGYLFAQQHDISALLIIRDGGNLVEKYTGTFASSLVQ